ncbi:hypothetical protein ACOMHN_060233 [Nucella lapillus]
MSEQIGRAGDDFQAQMATFLKEAGVEVRELEEDLKDIEDLRKDLAVFFSEDPASFKMEDCFKTLHTFSQRFTKAIQENKERKVMEEKAEQRKRQREAELKRNSKDVSEPADQSVDRAGSPAEGSIVDLLLADVRSGFCNRRYQEGSFNLTKVTKVSLDPASLAAALTSGAGEVVTAPGDSGDDFVRRGASSLDGSADGGDSLTHRRSRKSYATEDDASLIEFLMETELEPASPKPETTFDKYASLRRRRQERRERKNVLEVVGGGQRERAPSPVVTGEGSTPHGDRREARSSSAKTAATQASRPLRRTRSWLDRPSVDRALAGSKTSSSSSSKDEDTDALVMRIKNRLRGGDKDTTTRPTPPIIPEETSPTRPHPHPRPTSAPVLPTPDTPRSSRGGEVSRWRSSVGHDPLAAIREAKQGPGSGVDLNNGVDTNPDSSSSSSNGSTDPAQHTTAAPADSPDRPPAESSLEKSRRHLKKRYSTLDPASLSRLLGSGEADPPPPPPPHTLDDADMSVSVSMRKAMSDKNGINLDGLLKTIENSDRPLENFGVISPCKRQQQQPTETVAAMVTSPEPARPDTPPGEPPELKQKRVKRKKRSTLVLDDIQAALRTVSSDDHHHQQTGLGQEGRGTTPAPEKTPASAHHTGDNGGDSKSRGQSKEDKEAAKQAAKKNFRDARFGYKDLKSVAEMTSRCRSDVERQDVDQALRDLVSKGSMCRSKSYDESVARRASSEGGEEKMKNGVGVSGETRSLRRGSSSSSSHRLSTDGRRNGLYIPSDDSDTEGKGQDPGSRRGSSAKSDSPKSVSRLSIKSANTSTETLQAEKDSDGGGDSSPEQRRRSYVPEEGERGGGQRVAALRRPASAPAVELEHRAHRSYSYLDRSAVESAVQRLQTKVDQLEEDDDANPLASVAKWRLKRTKRLSVYDNVSDSDTGGSTNASPRTRSLVVPGEGSSSASSGGVVSQDYKNEVGSRSSYASSYASSTDTDQGFESMGNVSQRTSLSSTLESEILGTPTLGRKAESQQRAARDSGDGQVTGTGTGGRRREGVVGGSGLSEEDSRKLRTETWTEETLRVTAGQGTPTPTPIIPTSTSTSSSSPPSTLSPDSGHGTSKEEAWSETGSSPPHHPHKKGPVPLPPSHPHQPPTTPTSPSHPPSSSSSSSTTTTPSEASRPRSRPLPSYMRATNSSSRARTAVVVSPAPSDPELAFRRESAARKSFRGKDGALRREGGVRASMRAETALRRDAPARPARLSGHGTSSPSPSLTPKSLAPPPSGRPRTDSNASGVSSVSSASDVSSASTSKLTSARRVVGVVGDRPRTPSSRASTTPSGGLHRTQSVRVTSSRTSLGSKAERAATPSSSSAHPTHHDRRSATPLNHDTKPTASDTTTTPTTTTPTPKPHRTPSLSSTPPTHNAAPSPRPSLRSKSRFMEPTAASRAATSPHPHPAPASSPTPPPRTTRGGGGGGVASSLTRHGSLRLGKTSTRLTSSELPKGHDHGESHAKTSSTTAGKKVAPAAAAATADPHHLHLLHLHPHPSLDTVTEISVGEEVEGGAPTPEKSPSSLLKRVGSMVKGKDKNSASSSSSSSPAKKTVIVSSAQARDRKK